MADINELLKDLNPAQLQAVQHPPQIPLQILAGPGSGKTRVLTMRIAHLITNCYLPPWSICAVTFTNKAANEMRERLVKLLGKENTTQIKMGTFHALCAMFLRRYSKHVGIEGNFTVCDADESKKIIIKIMKPYQEELKNGNFSLQESAMISKISKLKAKGLTADDALDQVKKMNALSMEQRMKKLLGSKKEHLLEGPIGELIAKVYKEYEVTLRGSNSLDFDDLLLFGVKLFAKHKKASGWCRHVLVDEYQDTNTTQYDLMRYIAQTCKCVTVVGDPDQSIYGWRSAEIENLAKMKKDFPTTQEIYLEQNYRSTASIIAASMAIISQDENRIQKTLNTTHAKGPLPVLRAFPMEQVEAGFIAAEIKRLIAFTGGMLNWSDFVVLLRYNAKSRAIEAALQKEGIPNRVLAGHKFFERMEIKDILAYLQLIDNPAYVPAFTRIVNVPPRTVGEKTVTQLLHRAEQLKVPPLEVVERIVNGKIPDIKPPVKKKLSNFVEVISDLRKYANENMSPSRLIQSVLELVNYGEHLRKTQPDYDSRWENVQELINFASEIENNLPASVNQTMLAAQDRAHEELWGDELVEWDADQVDDSANEADTPLRLFLQASMLSTDTETAESEKSKEKVTISTCHAAKGLEWAVVMVPAVESGVFPSARSEDVEEERRLLYVACTRAQGLLYLTHATSRMVSGEQKPQKVSEFIAAVRSSSKTWGVVSEELPALTPQDRETLCKVLNRTPPDEEEVKRRVAEFEQTGRHPVWGINAPFRDDPDARQNGYGVPVRYHQMREEHNWSANAGPKRQLPAPKNPLVKRDSDGILEPPVFVTSSLVHFNDVHRAGIVSNMQPQPMPGSSVRAQAGPSSSRASTSGSAAPLASSSSRVVNGAASQPSPAGFDLRNWMAPAAVLDIPGSPSKGKGKAKAMDFPKFPGAGTVRGTARVNAEPVLAKVPPAMSAQSADSKARVASVKAEIVEPTFVKVETREPSLVKPKSRQAILAKSDNSIPILVKSENRERNLVKVENREPRLVKAENVDVGLSVTRRTNLVKLPPTPPAHRPNVGLTAIPPVSVATSVFRQKPSPTPSLTDAQPSSSGLSLPSSSFPSDPAPVSASPGRTLEDGKPTAVKRRLGMGRATGGYSNKKFKPLMPNGS